MMVSIKDYAIHSGLSSKAVRSFLLSGKLPYIKVGAKYFVLKEEADKLLAQMAQNNLRAVCKAACKGVAAAALLK